MKYLSRKMLIVVLGSMLGGSLAVAQTAVHNDTQAVQGQASPSADNTRMNRRDKGDTAQTPQAQSNAKSDRELLAAVRRTIVKDKSLSVYAHNIKILAQGGVVTLRGPVKSEDEKSKVETLAKSVAGVGSVDNKVDIKTN
ncbi:BON domain-containing protein [Duganella sp. HH101]|uniref:BON domain-containing protein n=1 Tax=Duganella sp. HH101 TaxID=1781066 RepID=UPI000894100C|nr:BON domain-containing protein [Duganella sp. HH101]OEZ97183.1 periplasmic protein [Duganella sp. HH101]